MVSVKNYLMLQVINLVRNFKTPLKEVLLWNSNPMDNNNLCHLKIKVLEYHSDLLKNNSHSLEPKDMVILEWVEVLAIRLKEEVLAIHHKEEVLAIHL